MGCDGLWSYLTNFVMRLKLLRYLVLAGPWYGTAVVYYGTVPQ